MTQLRTHVLAAGKAFGNTFRNPALRRLELAAMGSLLGSWSYFVALMVYAYQRGGPREVAAVSVIRLLPAAILSPVLSTLADRFPRRRVMVSSDLVRAALMGSAAAVIATRGSEWVVFALVGVTVVAGTPFRPAEAALLPAVARTPAELTAANVVANTMESVAVFVGPAIGGFLLAATDTDIVFALNGASFVWSALLVLGIRASEPVAERRRQEGDHGFAREVTEGLRFIVADRNVGTLVGLYIGQTLIAGALSVLIVVTALDVLKGGAADVGLLNAAIGVGGIVGGIVALALAVRERLGTDFALGLILYGAPLVLVGAVPNIGAAVIALGVVGLGNSLVDIAAVTLLQRIVPDEVLARVLGAMEGLLLGSIGLGAVAAPLLVDSFGARAALLIAGAVLPVLGALAVPWSRSLDAVAEEPPFARLLRDVEILAPLPPATLEQLARALVEVRLPAGATVIRASEPGDRFYILEDGVVEIEGNVFGPGSSFGEIALLRDVPRTATVTAHTDVTLHALERDEFLAAVTGHEPSSAAAEAIIANRLGELRAGLTTEPGAA